MPLAQFAPTGDAAVGVLTSTGEVYFKPVPNDGTLSNRGNGRGASAFPVQISAPVAGSYDIRLEDRQGSQVFSNVDGSTCRTNNMASGNDDSFFLCASDPRSSGSNPDLSPNTTSCEQFDCCGKSKTFTLTAGVNTLWLANREVCSLASYLTIPTYHPPPSLPAPPLSPPVPPPSAPDFFPAEPASGGTECVRRGAYPADEPPGDLLYNEDKQSWAECAQQCVTHGPECTCMELNYQQLGADGSGQCRLTSSYAEAGGTAVRAANFVNHPPNSPPLPSPPSPSLPPRSPPPACPTGWTVDIIYCYKVLATITNSRATAKTLCSDEHAGAVLAMPLSHTVDELCSTSTGYNRCHIGLEYRGGEWKFDFNDETPTQIGYLGWDTDEAEQTSETLGFISQGDSHTWYSVNDFNQNAQPICMIDPSRPLPPMSPPSLPPYDFPCAAHVTIPDGVAAIPDEAFKYCSSLTSVHIPASVSSIGSAAFRNCDNLGAVTIPENVTEILSWAFGDCYALSTVELRGSVTSIGAFAFSTCSALHTFTLPTSLESIGQWAFYRTSQLASIQTSRRSGPTPSPSPACNL